MAIVQATERGVDNLQMTPNFKVKTEGMTTNRLGDAVHKLSAKQAQLLGMRESLIAVLVERYGSVLVHTSFLKVV